MPARSSVAPAACCVIGFLGLLCFIGRLIAAAVRDGALASLDVEIRRWQSHASIPRAALNWANRTAGTQCGKIDGREVIVVGNAPTVHRLGAIIDAVDVVVRVNPVGERGGHRNQHAREHRGRVAHALHVNANHPPSRVQVIFGHFPKSACVWTRHRAATALQLGVRFADERVQEYSREGMVAAHPELRECGRDRFLTAGMLAVLHALARNARRPVLLAGITAFQSAGHAVTNSSWTFHEQQLERYHCIEIERKLLRKLIDNGDARVICDAAPLFGGVARRPDGEERGAASRGGRRQQRRRARARRRKE